MKILYLTYHGLSEHSGISKKILAQLIDERYNTYAMADITVETFDESLRKTLAKVFDALQEHLEQKDKQNGR